ncbi:C6 transcription factor [Colletotrichum higginsianum]|nr:C6 transcription factor [Colletotrichum higginsianum]
MLLSRPFLIDFVSRNIARSQALSTTWGDDTHTHPHPNTHTHTHTHTPQSSQPSPSSQLLVHACVDSAIRTVDLLSSLISDKNVAKRHPFVINSAFVSALVLGLAIFGDLDTTFPLDRGLDDARALLRKFSRHDPVASRELSIVEHLQGACVLYRERRARRKMECQGVLIGELFGTVHEGAPATTEMFRTGPGFFHRGAGGPGLGLGLVDHRHRGGSEAGEVSSVDQTVSLTTGSTDGPSMMDGEAGRGPNAPPMDMFLPMSPRTLLFDSYGQDMPFFPTIDASLTHLGYADDVMLSDTGVLPEPAC